MRMYDIITKKRDGMELTTEEIQFFIKEYTAGNVPDYQASALLMAIFLQKMNTRETVDLTHAMMNSGDVVDLSAIHGIKVDKHSTGGVGDTTTLILAPLVASCGVPVAKMSGRGLGHTGGTLDKLESIDGFKIEVAIDDFIDAVNEHKIAVIGQTANIAPADKLLYALRDVTATVDNISLIAGSIMSKKLAAGSDAIVLDVKCGSGAFVKTYEAAVELAEAMVDIGNNMERNTIGVITDMEQPLGMAIGNGLEVKEAIDTLTGKGPADLTELVLVLGANMVLLGGAASTYDEARSLVESKLKNGEAFDKFKEFISIQGGNPAVADDPSLLPQAAIVRDILAPQDGYVEAMKSDDVGIASLIMGAGRATKEDVIDLSAGIILKKKVGDQIKKGEAIATFYTSTEEKFKAGEERFMEAITFSTAPVSPRPLIKAIVSKDGVKKF